MTKFIAFDWDDTLANKSHMIDPESVVVKTDQDVDAITVETTPLLPGAEEALKETSKAGYINFVISDRAELTSIRVAQLNKHGIISGLMNDDCAFDKACQVIFVNLKSLPYLRYIATQNNLTFSENDTVEELIQKFVDNDKKGLLDSQKGLFIKYLEEKINKCCLAYFEDNHIEVENARNLGINAIHADSVKNEFKYASAFFQNKVVAPIPGTSRNEIISLIATAQSDLNQHRSSLPLANSSFFSLSHRAALKEKFNHFVYNIDSLTNEQINERLSNFVKKHLNTKRSKQAEKAFNVIVDLSDNIQKIVSPPQNAYSEEFKHQIR